MGLQFAVFCLSGRHSLLSWFGLAMNSSLAFIAMDPDLRVILCLYDSIPWSLERVFGGCLQGSLQPGI